MFNWSTFLEEKHVDFVTRGPNISKGKIGIACPFCRDDPSHHMIISLDGDGWKCWRDKTHSGKSPVKLIQLLLSIPLSEAKELVYGREATASTDADTWDTVERLLNPDAPVKTKLKLPKEFKPLDNPGILGQPVFQYLLSRGYSEFAAKQLIERFDLRFATSGPFAGRIIFPVRDQDGELLTWTGRAISKRDEQRYKTLSREHALAPISDCLLDLPRLSRIKGKALVVVEGPFDTTKMSYYGETLGIYTTCTFTSNVSETQIMLLGELRRNFKHLYIMYDPGAELNELRGQASLGCKTISIPSNVKDPGDLQGQQVLRLCRLMAAGQ